MDLVKQKEGGHFDQHDLI